MRKLVLELVVLASSLGIGCGSGSPGGMGSIGTGGAVADAGSATVADAGTDGGPVGTLCNGLGTALNTALLQCLKATPAFVSSIQTGFDPASCQDLGVAAAAGRVRVDSANAASCLSTFQAAAAACMDVDVAFNSSACQAAITGTVATGGACFADVDCAAGTCDTSVACPGVCIAFLTAGQPCTTGKAVCGLGLACDGATGTCAQLSATGGPCPCLPGNYCGVGTSDGGTSDAGTGTCVARKTSGPCTIVDQCAFGTICAQATCTPYVGVGAACVPSPDITACGLGSYCDPGTSKCVAWPVIGQSCAVFPFCQTGYCDNGTSICTALKAPGASCASPLECQPGNYCDLLGDSTCKLQKANGAACTVPSECQSQACTAGVCALGPVATCPEK